MLSIRSRRVKSTTCSGVHVTPESFGSIQNPLGAYRLPQAPTTIAVLRYRNRFVVGWVRLDFCPTFIELPSRQLPPRGRPYRCHRPYDTAFDRFASVSPDRILGLDATPVSLSETVLPGSGRVPATAPTSCEAVFRLSADRISSISRFPSAAFNLAVLRAIQAWSLIGCVTCRMLRSAYYPC